MADIMKRAECEPTYDITGVTQRQLLKLVALLDVVDDENDLDELFYDMEPLVNEFVEDYSVECDGEVLKNGILTLVEND